MLELDTQKGYEINQKYGINIEKFRTFFVDQNFPCVRQSLCFCSPLLTFSLLLSLVSITSFLWLSPTTLQMFSDPPKSRLVNSIIVLFHVCFYFESIFRKCLESRHPIIKLSSLCTELLYIVHNMMKIAKLGTAYKIFTVKAKRIKESFGSNKAVIAYIKGLKLRGKEASQKKDLAYCVWWLETGDYSSNSAKSKGQTAKKLLSSICWLLTKNICDIWTLSIYFKITFFG